MYNTKNILNDAGGKPIPQIYDPVADLFRELTGANVATNRYASDHIVWGLTSSGLLYKPINVDDDGHVQTDVLSSALPNNAATQTTLAAVLAKLSADPATQTTLAAILAKIIATPSTEAKQDTIIGHVDGIEGSIDGIETALGTLLTLAGYNAKADITQSALRDAIRGTSSKTLTDIATAISSLATSAKQDTLIAKDFATQTTLASILTKLADPATQTTLAAILTQLSTTGLKKIIDALPAGSNLIGKVGIDQTIPGTTNAIAMTSSIESVAAAPAVGAKTVTATAAEIFAGASVKANRRKLIIRNEDPILRLRIGTSTVTQQSGFPIEPGATVRIKFDPATAVAIYAISEGAALNTVVMEV